MTGCKGRMKQCDEQMKDSSKLVRLNDKGI